MAVKASAHERGFQRIRSSFLACDGPQAGVQKRTHASRAIAKDAKKGKLDQESGVKDLPIGR
jgi:hypothetical protein